MRQRGWRAACSLLFLLGVVGCSSRSTIWVFAAPWDPRSNAAVAGGQIPADAIVSGWVALDTISGAPTLLFADPMPPADRRVPQRFLMVSNYLGTRFHASTIRALGEDATQRARAADGVERIVGAGAYEGVVLDLEATAAADTTALLRVVEALAGAARRGGASVLAVAVPAIDTLAFPPRSLLRHVDRLVVMLYDQHWSMSAPGPIASRAWAREALAAWVRLAGADRLVAALPVYGYRWPPVGAAAAVGWNDMEQERLAGGRLIPRDSADGHLRIRAADGSELWLADSALVQGLAEDARRAGVRSLGVWRLGLEDPRVWAVLRH